MRNLLRDDARREGCIPRAIAYLNLGAWVPRSWSRRQGRVRDGSHGDREDGKAIGIYTSQCQTPGFTGWSQSGEDDFTHSGCSCLPAQAGQPFFQPGPFGPGFTPNSRSPKA